MGTKIITEPYDNMENQLFSIRKRHVAPITYPMHWHDFLELEIVISGLMKYSSNNQTYILGLGNAHVLCMHDCHGLSILKDTTLYCLHIKTELLDSEIVEQLRYNSFRCQFTPEEMAIIMPKLESLEKESDSQSAFQNLMVKSIVTEILIMLMRKSKSNEALYTPQPIQKLTAYINTHFTEDITLDKVAVALSFSPSYLGKLLKRQMGYTFNEYLNMIRLKQACYLLRTTNLPVREIAFQAGYNSSEYFLSVFKKNLFTTPSKYRKLEDDVSTLF